MAEDWLPLEKALAHLRTDPAADDVSDVQAKVAAAKAIVSGYLRRQVPWPGPDGELVPVPDDVVTAALLVLGELYENREAGATPLSEGVRLILWPHRNLRVM